MTARFFPFLTSLINPALVYRIDRVTDTVTFTMVVAGMPAGALAKEDFVFADEATAIAAVDGFVAEARALTLEDAINAATTGMFANASITTGALKNVNLGDVEARVEVFVEGVLNVAARIVEDYEAL